NFVYTFENADLVLNMMREGDVFCGILPDSGEALAIVVREIEKNGDSVTVYGVQPTLADLFETLKIEATYGADALIVDELAEGVTMEETPADPSLSAETPRATNLAANTGKGPTAQNLASQTVNTNLTFTQALNVETEMTYVEGSIGVTMESVTISLDYIRGRNNVVASVVARMTDTFRADLGIQTGWEDDFKVGEFDVRTYIPFITVPLELSVHAAISGSVNGTLAYEQTRLSGTEITFTSAGITDRDIDELVSRDVDADFVNFQAAAKIGPKLSIGVAVFDEVLRADLALVAGLKIEAEYAPFEPWDEFADSCHDCGVCFDGEISLFAELVGSAKASFPGLEPVTASITMTEATQKLNDFYVSLGPDGRADPRFGWGECPYRRYRTEVKVTSKYGEIYGAEVHAQYPDGRTDHQWADEFGMAVFWLPAGQNWLDAEYNERINGNYYTIPNKPSRLEIKLQFDQRIIVICEFTEIDYTGEEVSYTLVEAEEFGEVYSQLAGLGPQTEIYSILSDENTDWHGSLFKDGLIEPMRPGDILIDLTVTYETLVHSGSRDDNDYETPPYEYSGYNDFVGEISLAVNDAWGNIKTRTLGKVDYSLSARVGGRSLPDVHLYRKGGTEFVLREVRFDGEVRTNELSFNDTFDEISYEKVEALSAGEVEYWSGEEIVETVYYEWDYTYQFVANKTYEINHYYEENYSSWGNALIDHCMECVVEQFDRALIH
ncbi:MAG: hypothetical protein IKC99_06395, partial [Clostridia bacterium]|nr:hypothetical protein [Clostridia bacterium]